jgi:hypothetical protein
MYQGTIIEESLENKGILRNLAVLSSRLSEDGEWHMYKVQVTEDQIKELSKHIKPRKWYAHFWYKDDVIVIFKDRIFRFLYSDKATWRDAIMYGISVGIPEEQLDFIIK